MYGVTQLNSYGCGLACVAFVTERNYQVVLKLTKKDQANSKGFTCKELVELLSTYDKEYSYKYLKPKLKKKIYQDKVIVFIKRSKKYPAGHYLVRSDGMWMDPWINFQTNKSIKEAESGFRKRLPGKPTYFLFLK